MDPAPVSVLAETLEKIRQGCTSVVLNGACSGTHCVYAAFAVHTPAHGQQTTLRLRQHCTYGCTVDALRTLEYGDGRAHAACAHNACASRATGNNIGPEGAKELAAALITNTTITKLDLNGACSGALPSHPAVLHIGEGGLRRTARARAAHALATPTARAPRVPQTIRSAPRGPRSWPPRSSPTRPSPSWTSTVRAAAPFPLTLRSCT